MTSFVDWSVTVTIRLSSGGAYSKLDFQERLIREGGLFKKKGGGLFKSQVNTLQSDLRNVLKY